MICSQNTVPGRRVFWFLDNNKAKKRYTPSRTRPVFLQRNLVPISDKNISRRVAPRIVGFSMLIITRALSLAGTGPLFFPGRTIHGSGMRTFAVCTDIVLIGHFCWNFNISFNTTETIQAHKMGEYSTKNRFGRKRIGRFPGNWSIENDQIYLSTDYNTIHSVCERNYSRAHPILGTTNTRQHHLCSKSSNWTFAVGINWVLKGTPGIS